MIAHLWGETGTEEYIKTDPTTGIPNSQLKTTKSNDFDNFKWLGAHVYNIAIPNGVWVCLEGHVKLNEPY
jgi:hypothetical protein